MTTHAREQPFNKIESSKFKIMKPFFKVPYKRNLNNINMVVLHWTAGRSVESDYATLQKKGYGYHFLIDKEGNIFQGGPLDGSVSHAGNSYGPNGNGTNATSIGISFSTLGDEDKEVGSTTFNDAQVKAAATIIYDLKNGSCPKLRYVSGHHWVSPGRKIDPWTFPFDRLMKFPVSFKAVQGKIVDITLTSLGLELWKTGYLPFPEDLSDCKCIEKYSDGNCKKSTGKCKGQGGYGYSERKLSTVVDDASFQSDLDTT